MSSLTPLTLEAITVGATGGTTPAQCAVHRAREGVSSFLAVLWCDMIIFGASPEARAVFSPGCHRREPFELPIEICESAVADTVRM